jgi:hypothetical protein
MDPWPSSRSSWRRNPARETESKEEPSADRHRPRRHCCHRRDGCCILHAYLHSNAACAGYLTYPEDEHDLDFVVHASLHQERLVARVLAVPLQAREILVVAPLLVLVILLVPHPPPHAEDAREAGAGEAWLQAQGSCRVRKRTVSVAERETWERRREGGGCGAVEHHARFQLDKARFEAVTLAPSRRRRE